MSLPRRIEVPEEFPPIPLNHQYREFGNGALSPSDYPAFVVRNTWNEALDALGLTVTMPFRSLTPGASASHERSSQYARLANAHLLDSTVTYVRDGDSSPNAPYSARQAYTQEYNQLELLEGASLLAAEGLGVHYRMVDDPEIAWGSGVEPRRHELPITVDDVLTDIARVTVGKEVRYWTEPRGVIRPEMFRPLMDVCMDIQTSQILFDHLR